MYKVLYKVNFESGTILPLFSIIMLIFEGYLNGLLLIKVTVVDILLVKNLKNYKSGTWYIHKHHNVASGPENGSAVQQKSQRKKNQNLNRASRKKKEKKSVKYIWKEIQRKTKTFKMSQTENVDNENSRGRVIHASTSGTSRGL